MDKQSSDGSCSFMQTKGWDGCSSRVHMTEKQKHPLRFSFSLFLRVSSWWETKRDKSYRTDMYWRHILPWWIKPSAVDAIACQQGPACLSWITFPMVLKLPTSLCCIRAAGGSGLETCLVLYSPYLSVFALQLPPQYRQLLLSHTGQKKGLVACFHPPTRLPTPISSLQRNHNTRFQMLGT